MEEIEMSMKSKGPRQWANASLRLRPFAGTAFGKSISLLWTVCPVAVHQHSQHAAEQLDFLVKNYPAASWIEFALQLA